MDAQPECWATMLNVPNAITVARLVLVPVMGYFLAASAYGVALIVFMVVAFTDLIDGYIARAFRLVSTLGATLDPIADKLNMFIATVLLAWQGLIPIWLAVADHCLRSRNYVNVIIAGKQPAWQWLDIESAVRHCTAGIGVWSWASNDDGSPDVVMACAGDVPTLETLAAVTLLREYVPDIRVRVVNVVDLMALQPRSEHPHGLKDEHFDEIFTRDKPVIFAFHGYPGIVHRLSYRRTNHSNMHVRGYREESTTTTPFDMVVLNNLDRYQLAFDAIRRIPRLQEQVQRASARYAQSIERHKKYVTEHGEDMPDVQNWRWHS